MKLRMSLLVIALLFVLIVAALVAAAPLAPRPEPVAIGAHRLAGTHMLPPSKEGLAAILRQQGLPLDATPAQIQAAEAAWFERFQKHTETWVNPEVQEAAVQREAQLASAAPQAVVPVQASVFYLAVDFGAKETLTLPMYKGDDADGNPICITETHTLTGPLHGEIPQPPATDNFTLWYSPTLIDNPEFYEKLLFGYEGAGRVRMDLTDPVDGQPGINLAGYTMQDYYDRVAGATNVTIGGIVTGWVTVNHTEAWYGANNCATGSSYGGYQVPVAQLVADALAIFSDTHPTWWSAENFWQDYDGNGDGVVDSLGIIHAGVDESAGGGAEGPFALWAHSSDLRNYAQWPAGIKVYEGNPGPADDIVVGPYTLNPESLDVGVLSEEFGHNFFGLPDLYVNDASNSIGDWAIMSGGAWMGWLGGTTPASMPLWFKMIAAFDVGGTINFVNWHEPMVTRQYDDPAADVTIYNLENTPAGQNKGVMVSLPSYSETVPNNAGTGKAAYSGTARDQTDIKLERQLTIPSGAAGLLTIDAYWRIEEDWDYGYVTVNGAAIDDMDGITTDTNPNGNNLGNGITGRGDQILRFNLASYAGSTVTLGFRYKTDAAVTEAGWWIDDVKLDGVLVDAFEGATLPGTFPGWTNTDPGWLVVPRVGNFDRYYLVEWRAKTKYDKAIAETAYIHNYSDETHGDVVSRIPYNMPAAVMYYRDTKYLTTYAQRPNYAHPPSYGSKYQLLVVDQNWEPTRIFSGTEYYGYWTGRVSAYDAGLTLQDSLPWTIPHYWGDPALPPQNYAAKPAVTHFNDTLGYYGGFYFGAPCAPGFICYVERDGSVVIPARDLYSTRISTFNLNPLYGLYGAGFSPSWLGSGNPGDDNVQFGVNIVLKAKGGDATPENSWATLGFYNYSVDMNTTVTTDAIADPDVTYEVTYQTVVENLGNLVASGVQLTYDLGDEMIPVSLQIEGPAGVREEAIDVTVALPDIAPGEVATVTLVARPIVAPGPSIFSAAVTGHDGQVDRGPWFIEGPSPVVFIYLPVVTR